MAAGEALRKGSESLKPHKRGMDRRAFLALSALLATAPVMSGCDKVGKAVEAIFGSASEERSADVSREKTAVEPQEPPVDKVEQVKKFNFNEYQPVNGGQIVDSHLASPDAKTVIFFADEHPGPTSDDSLAAKFRHYQLSTFDNVSDLVRQHGGVDLSQEMSTEGVTAEALKDVDGEEFADVRRIARTTDPEARVQLGRDLAGRDYPNTVGACLIAAYPDKVNSIPVYTDEELREAYEWDGQGRDIIVAADHQEELPCMNDPAMSLAMAKDLKGGKGAKARKALECFCQMHHVEGDVMKGFLQNRHVDAPKKEVDSAIKGRGNFAVLIAGSMHLAGAIKYMRAKGVNYIVVAPSGEEESVKKYLRGIPQIETSLAPDPQGVCKGTRAKYDAFMKRMAAEAKRAQEKAMSDWLNED